MKESSDHIDHYRNKKAKSIPFIISIFHPVYSKFVGESTWILLKEQLISVLLTLLNVKGA